MISHEAGDEEFEYKGAEVLESPERRKAMVDRNYNIARKHYSYDVLRKRLSTLINIFFGTNG